MKNILKWTLFILTASVALAAGMYCLAEYFDSKETNDTDNTEKKTYKSASKSFNRHYTKLTLN